LLWLIADKLSQVEQHHYALLLVFVKTQI